MKTRSNIDVPQFKNKIRDFDLRTTSSQRPLSQSTLPSHLRLLSSDTENNDSDE